MSSFFLTTITRYINIDIVSKRGNTISTSLIGHRFFCYTLIIAPADQIF